MKTQIRTAVAVYVLVAIIKKHLNINLSLYTMLQILSVSVFEKMTLVQILTNNDYNMKQTNTTNQLILFDVGTLMMLYMKKAMLLTIIQ